MLAELIFERLSTIHNGRAEAEHRGPTYQDLVVAHPYRGLLLDRVIIGQRIGMIYADAKFRAIFSDKLDRYLAAFIAASGDKALTEAYLAQRESSALADATLRPGFVQASHLRAAPALGAAVAAVRAATA